jgi:hypothetical protein
MMFPNFIIIGAAKSGTSSLYYYLSQHPQVYTSLIKGPAFFAFEEGQKVRVYGPGDQAVFDRFVVTDRAAYQALFRGVRNEKAVGEGTVLYLYSPMAPTRIKRYIPEAKLIVCLRNPVDRAYSSYLHLKRDGRERLPSFKVALEAEEERVKANWQHLWHYTRLGFYHDQLKRYYDLFHPDQIGVYIFDDFKANPTKFVQDIFRFLEVDCTFVPDMSIKRNISGMPKSRTLHTFLTRPNALTTVLRQCIPRTPRLHWWATAMKLNLVRGKSELTPDIRAQLTELYRGDIIKLELLIQRDLSAWLETNAHNFSRYDSVELR